MAIAFYNVGAELEHLRHYKEAHLICKNGSQICEKALGNKHVLCEKLRDFVETIEKYKEVQEKQLNTIKIMRTRPNEIKHKRQKTVEKIRLWKSPYKFYMNLKENDQSFIRNNRAKSVMREKTRSPEREADKLVKNINLPQIKTPIDKYYDYKVSQLMKKSRGTMQDDTENSLKTLLGISFVNKENSIEVNFPKNMDKISLRQESKTIDVSEIPIVKRQNTSFSIKSEDYQTTYIKNRIIPFNKRCIFI